MINNEILMSDIDQIKESIDKMDVVPPRAVKSHVSGSDSVVLRNAYIAALILSFKLNFSPPYPAK